MEDKSSQSGRTGKKITHDESSLERDLFLVASPPPDTGPARRLTHLRDAKARGEQQTIRASP